MRFRTLLQIAIVVDVLPREEADTVLGIPFRLMPCALMIERRGRTVPTHQGPIVVQLLMQVP